MMLRRRPSLRDAFVNLFAVLLVLAGSWSAWADGAAGRWRGSIEIPTQAALEIEVVLTESDAGDWSGVISIPAQNASNLPLRNVAVENGTVRFEIADVPGQPRFEGELSDDGETVAGSFRQGAMNTTFTLSRSVDYAAEAAARLDGFADAIDQLLADIETPGVAVGIVYHDEVVFAQGFGKRNVEDDLPMTADTLLAIGSSTKAFTTFALGQLVDEGELDWDEPVATYLPDFRLHDEYASLHLTPRDLVTHRSGLPRHDLVWYNLTEGDRADLVHRLRHLEPNRELRQTWQYNNLMYLTAGYLLGELDGTSWEDSVRARVFEPLGMDDSNFSVHDSQSRPDFAAGYQRREKQLERMNFRDISLVGPAGSINSSVNDMVEWLRVHLNEGVVDGEHLVSGPQLKDMHTVQMAMGAFPSDEHIVPVGYGLGWMIDVYKGVYRVHHGGNIDGFSANVALFPRKKLGVVVLTNMNGSPLPEIIAREAADRLLELPRDEWFSETVESQQKNETLVEAAEETKIEDRVADTAPSHDLDAYAGSFEHPGYGVISIALDEDQLAVEFNGITAPLEHWHFDVFRGMENPDDRTFDGTMFEFENDRRGRIGSLRVVLDAFVDPIEFTRRPDVRLTDPAYLAQFAGVWTIAGQTFRTLEQGGALYIHPPNQPPLKLIPEQGLEFRLEVVEGFGLRFEFDDDGVVQAKLIQPDGIFPLERVDGSADDDDGA